MQRIVPCLWFDDRIEEAVNFYCSVFSKSEIVEIARYGEGAPRPAGTVLTIRFVLGDQEFLALNGGPQFKFTEAVSFVIPCKSQKKVDYYWHRLSEGGEESMCGWLKDKYGLSWQVVPKALPKMLKSKHADRRQRVMQAMLQMKKLDVDALEAAYEGKTVPAPARRPRRRPARPRGKPRG